MLSLIEVLSFIEHSNSVLAVLLNLLLLFAIRRFSRSHLGTYKHLLIIFTATDILLVILQEITRPESGNFKALMIGYTHGVVTDIFVEDRSVTSFYIASQSIPFFLLIIHFLYRYLSVRRPHLIKLFSRKPFWVVLFAVATTILLYFMCMYGISGEKDSVGRRAVVAEYERRYGKRIENAWLVLDHWRDNKFDPILSTIVVSMDTIMIASLILAYSLAYLTFRHINRLRDMSSQSNNVQKKLLTALCTQAAVPYFFVFIPFLLCINIPFFRIPITIVHDFGFPLLTCFPVWDAAVIIILISDYRNGLLRLMQKKRVQRASIQFTSGRETQ